MFESLISSRTRRTLFEYIVIHPDDRFYLRGLAKELGLSVSPLRRELKQLERAGMLKAVEEANIRFYSVDAASPAFLQLRQAGQGAHDTAAVTLAGLAEDEPEGPQAADDNQAAAPSRPRITWAGERPQQAATHSLNTVSRAPLLIGAAGMGMALLALIAGLFFYVAHTARQQVASETSKTLATRRAQVTVVVPPPAPSGSGTMRGARWQIVPGGFGGFSSGPSANQESY